MLKVLRLGNRWDLAFHQSLKRDAKGEVVEFDIDPRLIEQFGAEAAKVDAQRTWTRATSSCWSRRRTRGPTCAWSPSGCLRRCPCSRHVEIARGVQIKSLGTIS